MTCPDLARIEIETLRADGIEPTLDELTELIELGRRAECPHGRTNPVASRAPIRAGVDGPRLWPLTLQAEAWIEQHAGKLETLGAALVCYASAIGREPGAFDGLATWRDIGDAVREWAAGLTCTADDLADAADRLTGGQEPETAPGDPDARADIEDMLAALVVESGQPIEYWLAHTSAEFVAALDAVASKRAASAGMARKDMDESAQAMRNLMWAAKRVRDRAAKE